MKRPDGIAAAAQRPIAQVPGADARAVISLLGACPPAVFLDYDGTLTPIVDDPAAATISDDVRDVLARLARRCPVAVVSGRDLADVRGMVGVDRLTFAGSHGLDIEAGTFRAEKGSDFLPALEQAEAAIRAQVLPIAGARVERKRFAVAVHFRQVQPSRQNEVAAAVSAVAAAHPDLRVTGGKMILELRPALDWHKGTALLFLLDSLGLAGDRAVPLYIGDDVTDEDAFRVLVDRGVSLVVRGEDDQRLTVADYALEDPTATVAFLRALADELDSRSPAQEVVG